MPIVSYGVDARRAAEEDLWPIFVQSRCGFGHASSPRCHGRSSAVTILPIASQRLFPANDQTDTSEFLPSTHSPNFSNCA